MLPWSGDCLSFVLHWDCPKKGVSIHVGCQMSTDWIPTQLNQGRDQTAKWEQRGNRESNLLRERQDWSCVGFLPELLSRDAGIIRDRDNFWELNRCKGNDEHQGKCSFLGRYVLSFPANSRKLSYINQIKTKKFRGTRYLTFSSHLSIHPYM